MTPPPAIHGPRGVDPGYAWIRRRTAPAGASARSYPFVSYAQVGRQNGLLRSKPGHLFRPACMWDRVSRHGASVRSGEHRAFAFLVTPSAVDAADAARLLTPDHVCAAARFIASPASGSLSLCSCRADATGRFRCFTRPRLFRRVGPWRLPGGLVALTEAVLARLLPQTRARQSPRRSSHSALRGVVAGPAAAPTVSLAQPQCLLEAPQCVLPPEDSGDSPGSLPFGPCHPSSPASRLGTQGPRGEEIRPRSDSERAAP